MATLPSTVRSNETKYKLSFRITKNMYQYVQRTAWSLNISFPKNQKDPKDPRNRYVHDRAKEKKNRFRDINIILKNHEKDHRSGEGREKWRARAIFRPRFRASPFIFGLAFIALRNFFSPCAFREREDVREGERGRRGDDAPFRGTQGPRRVTNCNHGQQSATDALPNSALRWEALFFADREAALSRLHIDSSTHFIWIRSFQRSFGNFLEQVQFDETLG